MPSPPGCRPCSTATLALAVLDPAGGTLRYATCGHPPPLVIGTDGTARYLEGTGTGPLGTGSAPVLAESALAPGELVLLYSDGLIERPDRTVTEGMAELAAAPPTRRAGACRATAPRRGGTGVPADRGDANPARPRRRHHRAGRAAACRAGPGPAPGAAERAVQPHRGAGCLRRLAGPARRRRRRLGGAAPGHGGGVHQRHRARLPARRAGAHHAGRVPGRRRQHRVPDHRPRPLAAARPGRGRPRPRPDGRRARRRQAGGQPPCVGGRRHGRPGDDGDAAAPADAGPPSWPPPLTTPRPPRNRPSRRSPWTPRSRRAPRRGRWSAAGSTSPPPTSWPGGCCRSAAAARSRSSPTSPVSPSWPARGYARCTRSGRSWPPTDTA